jgi:tetratricopeptide (TPR) repeat protein
MATAMLAGSFSSTPVDAIISRYGEVADDARLKEAAQSLVDAEGYLDDADDPRPQLALKAIESAKDFLHEIKHTIGIADVSRLAARAEVQDGQDNVIARLKSQIAEFEAAGQKHAKGIVTLAKAELTLDVPCRVPRDVEEAVFVAIEAADIFQKHDDARMEACAHIVLAKLQNARKLPKEALSAAEKAVELANGSGDLVLLAKAMQQVGEASILNEEIRYTKNGFKTGLQSFKNALGIYQELYIRPMVAYVQRDSARCMLKCLYKPKTAVDMAFTAYMTFQELNKPKSAITCLEVLIQARIKYKDFENASKDAFAGVMYFKKIKDSHDGISMPGEPAVELAKAWMLMCEVHTAESYWLSAQAQKGVEAIGNAVELLNSLQGGAEHTAAQRQVLLLRVLLLKAKAESASNALSDAASTLQVAKDLAKTLSDPTSEASVLACEVEVSIAAGDTDSATQAADDQRDIFLRLGMKSEEASALLMSAMCSADRTSDKSEASKGLTRAREARTLAQQAKDAKVEADALLLITKICKFLDSADEALEASSDLLKVLERVPQADKTRGEALSLMAKIYMEKNVFDEALKSAEKAAACAKHSEDPLFEAETLIILAEVNYGVAIRQEQNTRQGIQIFHKCSTKSWQSAKLAKARCERFKFKDLLRKALCAMAEVGVVFDADEATRSAEEAEMLSAEADDEVGVATAVLLQANILYHRGQNPSAKAMAEKGMRLAEEAGLPELLADARDLIQRTQGAAAKTAAVEDQEGAAVAAVPIAAAEAVAAVGQSAGLDPVTVTETVTRIAAQSVAADEDLEQDTPLMDAGLDSLSSVAFRNTLANELNMKMPASLMFDYPNIRQLTDYIVEASKS